MNGPITFAEFKEWLTNLIIDNKGVIPGKEEWREIKTMLDRVAVPNEEINLDWFNAYHEYTVSEATLGEWNNVTYSNSNIPVTDEMANELAADLQLIIDEMNNGK